jgi:hypothetical protein
LHGEHAFFLDGDIQRVAGDCRVPCSMSVYFTFMACTAPISPRLRPLPPKSAMVRIKASLKAIPSRLKPVVDAFARFWAMTSSCACAFSIAAPAE